MNKLKYIILFPAVAFMCGACSGLLPDKSIDLELREEQASLSYANLKNQGMMSYDYLPKGYDWLDDAMLSSATDESDHAPVGSDVEQFQLGNWTATSTPDNKWNSLFRGIRLSTLFLRNSENYEETILRDISTVSNKEVYEQQCADLKALRAEVNVMIAYMYFELIKRYGGVPIVGNIYSLDDEPSQQRESYDKVVDYIVKRIDGAYDDLRDEWQSYDAKQFGRLTKGSALAIKSRILLYWASPLNNTANDLSRWEEAVLPARDIILSGAYELASGYRDLFLGINAHQNREVILAYMTGSVNTPETHNYPITTNGGLTGTCPSANLVDAYENIDGTPFSWSSLAPGADPYSDRDPRLQQTVVVNGSTWNGRTMATYEGGFDGLGVARATTTGYYLKKFLTDNLDLELSQKAVHSWILFRYAEILLNYAEAMNEAYGPDADPFSDGRTARWAVNKVRTRAGMPDVAAAGQSEMRESIKHERRIELAFEDHRFWDVRRWGLSDAKKALDSDLLGVRITKEGDHFKYENFTVEKRVFEDKMILYPVPHKEIMNTSGIIIQNPGWN